MKVDSKFIFVTGGVCSSLGKGIIAASSAAILKAGGKKVALMKLDPYLNVDPGTMSPFQHGEVFVCDDGSETDLDLGHYERFIDEPLSSHCTVSTGQVYSEVLDEERRGKYLGGTIQVVPHITGKIMQKVEQAAKKLEVDVLVVEIGGTVGDIEGEPFIEVVRQMKKKYGDNLLTMHATLLPFLAASGELKTKPTQLSVRELRRMGISPEVIFLRSDFRIPKAIMKKVSYFCDVEETAVIPAETIKSIYEVPLKFQKHGLGKILADFAGDMDAEVDLSAWEAGVKKIKGSKSEVSIGLAGKYNELDDAYISVIEGAKAAGYFYGKKVNIEWIDTEKIEANDDEEWAKMKAVEGVIVPGGFGARGTEGKVKVAQYCREEKKPYLGLCLGSQIMAMDFARNVLGINDATSEEFDKEGQSKNHVVHIMEEQKKVVKKGASMRLGAYPCALKSGTKAHKAYGEDTISERHRHRFEFNNDYRDQFKKNGFVISGTSPDGDLVEIVEIKDHPFMVGAQFHPEFKSRPFRPHPLFRDFMGTVVGK